MCLYFKKYHTCGCISRCYLEMCRPGILTSTICTPLAEPPNDPSSCRKSYFPCYECLRASARAEVEAQLQQRMQAESDKKMREEMEAKAQALAEKRARNEKIRKEAAEKAALERVEDEMKKAQAKAEVERAKKEGGLWIDANAGKKKGKKSGPNTPRSAPAVAGGAGAKVGEFGGKKMGMFSVLEAPKSANGVEPAGFGAGKMGQFGKLENEAPKTDPGADPGGRAGIWGAPKKILTNNERNGGAWRK